MPRTRTRGRGRKADKSKKRDRGRRLTLRGRTKRRGGWYPEYQQPVDTSGWRYCRKRNPDGSYGGYYSTPNSFCNWGDLYAGK